MGRQIYFESYSEAVQTARGWAEDEGFVVPEEEWDRKITFGTPKPSVGSTTRVMGIEVERKNGKGTRAALHIQVYGMPSGKYELNSYIG